MLGSQSESRAELASISYGVHLNDDLVSGFSKVVNRTYLDQLNDMEFILEVHRLVVVSNLPNYRGCRIHLRMKLNIPFWREMLSDYQNEEIVDFLEFGFPLGINGIIQDNPPCKNHNGATKFAESVEAYIAVELQAVSIVGPLQNLPYYNIFSS